MNKLGILSTVVWVVLCIAFTNGAEASRKMRVIATTDGEVDDRCSMIRFLMYANEWDIKGLIFSSSKHHWKGEGKDPGRKWHGIRWIQEQIGDYAKVYPNLKKHDPDYPSPDYLKKQVFVGNIKLVGDMRKAMPGSDRIVEVLLDPDPSPVWLQAWDGPNTISRALKTIEEKYRDRVAKVSRNARLYLIGEQDTTYWDYVHPKWPDVLALHSSAFGAIAHKWQDNIRPELHKYFYLNWINRNILQGHCPLRSRCDAHSKRAFRSGGDSPSFMHVMPVGLRSDEHPTYGGWGGRFELQGRKGIPQWMSAEDDGDKLTYKWWQCKEPGSYPGLVKIRKAEKHQASFVVPDNVKKGLTVHIICEVIVNGTPPLTRYRPVIVTFTR